MRDMVFDPSNGMFYYFEADYLRPRPHSGRPIVMYIIDPTDGSVTTKNITGGCVDTPVGCVAPGVPARSSTSPLQVKLPGTV